jgi:hypothetical protein
VVVHVAVKAMRSARAHRKDRRQGDDDRRSPAPPPSPRKPRRRHVIGIALVSLALLTAGTCKKPPHSISDVSETFEPRDVPWNGVKVYLSSPRHASSGDRGECGWEENINGRIFNLYAADLNDSETLGTLTTRGYETRVSPNSRDDGWRLNRDESDNWGANVHIVTHTNAFQGCGSTAQYLLIMFKTGDANSIDLKNRLLQQLDPQIPGGQNSWNCDNLGECAANAAHIAYIELFFHTNQAATDWFNGPGTDPEATGGMAASPYLGVGLDEHLGHPRAVATSASTTSLDRYAGFGRSPEAALRDETIAYWEAFEREQLIRECMAGAGFDYAPAVAFPREDMLEVAENLGIGDPGSSAAASPSSPTTWNREYELGLSGEERERYNQTLLGESAADVTETDRTGVVPAGRPAEEFASGGCFGEAKAAIPSIWVAQRSLTADVGAMGQEIAGSAEMRGTVGEYAECAEAEGGVTASGPGDLEELIADGGAPADDAATAYEGCASVWAAGYERAATAAAERFVERHASELDAAAEGYDGVMDRIAQDQDLATYLAARVAEAS